MRIQHNIMAMGAYRNYTNNLSAMKKNLEKLSSGYKINRAGDDAAGLAISEKMRAQITGLTTAQKNAKDGISLVQTAEGALTEVHDMLNRMVELATQAANGTYDNETDRAQMQKELDQLKSEIDRIADSSNFNGINLLDGSMDKSTVSGVDYNVATATDLNKLFVRDKHLDSEAGKFEGDIINEDKDILETEGGPKSTAGFEIDMDGTSVTLGDGETFTLNIGDKKLEFKNETGASKTYTSTMLADELAKSESAKEFALGGIDKNGNQIEAKYDIKADGKKLVFTVDDNDKRDFSLKNNASVTWEVKAAVEEPTEVEVPATASGTLNATDITALDGAGPVAAKYSATFTVSGADNLAEGNEITVAGTTYTVVDGNVHEIRGDEVDLNEINTEEGLKKFIAEKLDAADSDYSISVGEDGKLLYEAYKPGTVSTGTGPSAAASAPTTPAFAQGNGATAPTTTVTIATPTEVTAGKNAVGATKFIKLSDEQNDAIGAAAEKAGAADGSKITIKLDAANGKAQLLAGDKTIAEATVPAGATVSTTVTFKDADGNALLKASLVGLAGTEDAMKDGFDTGLTYVAEHTEVVGSTGGAATLDSGIMAFADDTGSGTESTGTPATVSGAARNGATIGWTADATGTKTSPKAIANAVSITFDGGEKVLNYVNENQIKLAANSAQDVKFGKISATGKDHNGKVGLYVGTKLVGVAVNDDGSMVSAANIAAGNTSTFKFAAIDETAAAPIAGTNLGTLTLTAGDVNITFPTTSSNLGYQITPGADPTNLKTVNFSVANNAKILAAAEKAGVSADSEITLKSDGTNVALYAGDTKISADATPVFTAAGFDIKDAEGNTLLKVVANGAGAAANIGDLGTDPIKTGLSFRAARDSKMEGTANSNIDISGDADPGKKAVYTVDLTGKDQTNLNGKKIDGVTIDWAGTSVGTDDNYANLNDAMAAFVTKYNETTGKNYTASWANNTLTLTAKNAGVVGTKPQTDVGGSDADMTEATAGVDSTPATKRADASGLDTTAIQDLVSNLDGVGSGDITLEAGTGDYNGKLVMKLGDTVIGVSDETIESTTTSYNMKGVDDAKTPLGTVSTTGGVGLSELSKPLNTGLKFTSSNSGTTTLDPGTTEVVDISKNAALKDMESFTKDTPLDAAQAAALKTALQSAGENGVITLADANNAKVDLSKIDVAEGDTVGDVAAKIYAAAQAAVEKANEGADSKYKVLGVTSTPDKSGEWLAGSNDAAAMALAPMTGFYIQTAPDMTEDADQRASGTINSGLQNVTDNNSGESGLLANVKVDFDVLGAWDDGSKITIGDTTYTVAMGADSKFKNTNNVIDMTDIEKSSMAKEELRKIASQRLTVAANGNSIFNVGHDGEGNTTLQQRTVVKETTDMSTHEKVANYLGVSTADADSVETAKIGHSLTLQIGDTAAKYNQLNVSIKDMHSEALGLGSISIADQDAAALALDKIKAAINTVSDVRGTLGATQNRLDHTINNLSVMTENIQDAESTIRDTDVADEMMAYTKNNILIQSAQAMLAQANQVPQGVLQLLQ